MPDILNPVRNCLIAEYNGSGTLQRRYVHGAGVDEPLVWYEGASVSATNRQYLHADYQGSIVATTNAAGTTLKVNTYDPYGITAATNIWRFQYTGQAAIPELGLLYYKARFYNPGLGRFMQTDPIGYEDDVNLYAYVSGDPVNRRDPTGRSGSPIVWRPVQFTEGRRQGTWHVATAAKGYKLIIADAPSGQADAGKAFTANRYLKLMPPKQQRL